MSSAGTKRARLEEVIKETSETGARISLSCAEVACVRREESEALNAVEEAIDMDAVNRNREQDKGKKLIPWKLAKRMLKL